MQPTHPLICHKSNPYGQLKTVMLGRFYPEDYFDCVQDPAVRLSLRKIAREIEEDLCFFQNVLQSHGVQVIRPTIASKESFADVWINARRFLTPPLQPRNHHTVVGDKIYQLTAGEEVTHINAALPVPAHDLCESNQQVFWQGREQNINCCNSDTNTWYCRQKYLELAGPDWPDFYDYVRSQKSDIPIIQKELESFQDALCYETKEFGWLAAPNLFPVDDRLYVDCKEYFDYGSWAKKHTGFAGDVVVFNSKAKHTDGCFVILGKKVIIGIDSDVDYGKIFPGYRVVRASDSYQACVDKRKKTGAWIKKNWWVTGEENNAKLINHVDTYMQNFVGTAYETSFDLNVLAINQNTICMIVCDPEVVKKLNDYEIDVIEIPWRHRFFVDCGLHCITLDLCREDQ